MKKYFVFLLIVLSTILVFPVNALAVANSGFIPGQIWYSKDILVEGDTVNIHTAVWNGEKDSVSVKVEFYDGSTILGSRDIVLASSELKDVYIPWKITAGDHIISAKITSSTTTVSGKKSDVVLGIVTTSNDRQFIPVVVTNSQGVPVSTATDALTTQIDKTTTEIDSIVPGNIRTPVADAVSTVDNFRDKTSTQINKDKDATQKEVDLFKSGSTTNNTNSNTNIEDATKKPITYIKLYLLTILAFIFNNRIVFYALLLIVVVYIIRFIYRTIRNR
jgi:hypothetical protein